MTDRDVLLSRRRAFLLAAAAGTLSCGNPVVCLSPPEPCLSPPMPPCSSIRWIAFSGPSTALDADATTRIDQLAKDAVAQGLQLTLASRLYDDGHADTAEILRDPRLVAVEEALVARGVQSTQMTRATPTPLIAAPEWQQLTGIGNPLTQSGLVHIDCR